MTTVGCRPSARSGALAWLKYASVYQPARSSSTGRSKTSGERRCLRGELMLELEARGQRGLGHLELRRRRLGGREPVLELVTRLRERLSERVRRVPRHPAEELGGGGDRAELRDRLRLAPPVLGRQSSEGVADRRGDQER